MAISSARLLANRRNALNSTGPKTPEGKAQSRQNAYQHGLTGNGIVLPVEDANEVVRRFEKLQEENQPSGEAGRILLRRFAYLSVRLEKCEQFDTSATAERVRHAVEVFDDNRLTEVEQLASKLDHDPMTMARKLQNSPEGVDWLIHHWGELRTDLRNQDRAAWTLNHWTRVEQLLGRPGGSFRIGRTYALTQAISGYFVYLDKGDGEGLSDADRIEWARDEMGRLIDEEIARLREVKLALNPDLIAQDRLEAPSRALFDPSPAMNLARKYEAATERAMYKALDQFHEVELAALEAEPFPPNSVRKEPYDTVASFFPAAEPEPEPAPEPPHSAPQSVYLRAAMPAISPKVMTKPRNTTKSAEQTDQKPVPV